MLYFFNSIPTQHTTQLNKLSEEHNARMKQVAERNQSEISLSSHMREELAELDSAHRATIEQVIKTVEQELYSETRRRTYILSILLYIFGADFIRTTNENVGIVNTI